MNEDNPNNREKRVLVFHNQWLYGHTALSLNLDILKRIKKGIRYRKKALAKNKKEYINHNLEGAIKTAVDYVGLIDIHNERKSFISSEFEFKGFSHLGKELSLQDNNNGFFICEIDKDLKLKYCFISGFEDENPINEKTPEEYLKLFYPTYEEEFKPIDLKKILKIFEEYKKIKTFKKSDKTDIVRELNKNPPSWIEPIK